MQAVVGGSEPDFSVAGVAADGLETVRLTERLKPDVLVLDLMMPGLSGLEALRVLRERSPRTRMVMLSFVQQWHRLITQALDRGNRICPEGLHRREPGSAPCERRRRAGAS